MKLCMDTILIFITHFELKNKVHMLQFTRFHSEFSDTCLETAFGVCWPLYVFFPGKIYVK